jgi:phosphopantothenoylcysteine decarboxylase/phosphopantothenate--cysteine ligase
MHYLKDRKILVGVTGSIAAYKALELVSRLKQLGAEVRVVMTQNAEQFVTPLSFATLSQNEVLTNTFTDPLAHIALAKWPELILIAPATANIMAKYAHGFGDDLLTTILLATTAKVAIAPAMNQAMWAHPAVQENYAKLQARNVDFIGPAAGLQACGDVGLGRMAEVDDIINVLPKYFQPQILAGKKVVITAGPTQEPLDPVRYLTNYSSGKMGYALAASCYYHGAEVILISGPTGLKAPAGCGLIKVTTAQEMQAQVLAQADADIIIGCAAVCDFKAQDYQSHKIKKSGDLNLNLALNEDIMATLGKQKHKAMLIGFAAETENLIENAKKKLQNKKLDMIIANPVGDGVGFNQDEQEIFVITVKDTVHLPKQAKAMLADQIIGQLFVAVLH